MMNNYLHDVATALLAASGVSLWVIIRRFGQSEERAVKEYFLSIHKGMTRIARFALIWILVGGVPRTIFYRSFEWANAVDHAQIPALIVKHILAFAFVGTGVYLWLRLNKKVKAVEQSLKEA